MTEQEIEDLEITHLLRVYRPDFRTPELKEEIRQKLERRGLLR